MANEEWNAIDSEKQEFKDFYCAFIDILGYKDKVNKFFDNKYNLLGRIERAMNTANLIDNISARLTDKTEKKVKIFSDSIVITYPVSNNNFLVLLNDIQNISVQLSMEDLFIRGGIAKGKHIETEINVEKFPFLASEALVKAYSLEQDEERKPRVLIENDLIKNICQIGKDRIVQENKKYFVDFASILINNNLDKQAVFLEMEDISENIKNTNNGDVKDKYYWILDYYFWTLTQDGNYDENNFKKFKSKIYDTRNFSKLY